MNEEIIPVLHKFTSSTVDLYLLTVIMGRFVSLTSIGTTFEIIPLVFVLPYCNLG